MKTQAAAILHWYKHLDASFPMPSGIHMMDPYADPQTWKIVEVFYKKFYGDAHPRVFIYGINPGRFGGGITGIPFTDPQHLAEQCGIPNPWQKKYELSAQFVYKVVELFGGPKAFYRHFFISAMSPLGFTWNKKNLNYYDNKELLKASEPFILQCIRQSLDTMPTIDTCFCLGEGENYKQFRRINDEHRFFKEIIPLPHPRWVMQYRRKSIGEFAAIYVEKLGAVLSEYDLL